MKIADVTEYHEKDFTIEDNKLRVVKPYAWHMVEWGQDKDIISTENPRAYMDPQLRMLSILDGTGKVHLEFKVLQDITTATVLFKFPEDAPNTLDRASTQTWDGGMIWYNSNSKNIYGKGLKAGNVYAVDLLGFFGD
nr:MAG TPA: hypothetical protein [Caudoviricetes sp.]